MNIWVTRHGQTNLNRERRMQGRTDEPLNEEGIRQAMDARGKVAGIVFDAVYSSPLKRAVETAVCISGKKREDILVDEHLTEIDFGRYERKKYAFTGLAMALFWLLPKVFPAPKTVESILEMKTRCRSFFRYLGKQPYENVLIVCHGVFMRVICGYLENKKSGIKWWPKPGNCEIRFFANAKIDGKNHID